MLGDYRSTATVCSHGPTAAQVHPNLITRTFAPIITPRRIDTVAAARIAEQLADATLDAGVELVDVSKRLRHRSFRVTADVYAPASTSRDGAR